MALPKGLQPAITAAILEGKQCFLCLKDNCRAASVSCWRKDKGTKSLFKIRNTIHLEAPGLTIFLRGQSKANIVRRRPFQCGYILKNINVRTERGVKSETKSVVVDIRAFEHLCIPGTSTSVTVVGIGTSVWGCV